MSGDIIAGTAPMVKLKARFMIYAVSDLILVGGSDVIICTLYLLHCYSNTYVLFRKSQKRGYSLHAHLVS